MSKPIAPPKAYLPVVWYSLNRTRQTMLALSNQDQYLTMKTYPSGLPQSPEQQIPSGHPFALYRGFSGPHFGINHPFTNPYLEKPRQPRCLPTDKQNEIGEWFVKKFQIDYWNASLFATGSFPVAKAYAGDYGSVGILEPEDKSACSICWSPVHADLYGELESRPHAPAAEILGEGKYEVFMWQDEQKRHESILSGHELLVNAPSFIVTKWINP